MASGARNAPTTARQHIHTTAMETIPEIHPQPNEPTNDRSTYATPQCTFSDRPTHANNIAPLMMPTASVNKKVTFVGHFRPSGLMAFVPEESRLMMTVPRNVLRSIVPSSGAAGQVSDRPILRIRPLKPFHNSFAHGLTRKRASSLRCVIRVMLSDCLAKRIEPHRIQSRAVPSSRWRCPSLFDLFARARHPTVGNKSFPTAIDGARVFGF